MKSSKVSSTSLSKIYNNDLLSYIVNLINFPSGTKRTPIGELVRFC